MGHASGEIIRKIDAVILAGDLFDRARPEIIDLYCQRYECGKGEKRIHFPVYPGFGNHDLDTVTEGKTPNNEVHLQLIKNYMQLSGALCVFWRMYYTGKSDQFYVLRKLRVGLNIANVISIILAILFAYVVNSRFVFQDKCETLADHIRPFCKVLSVPVL